MLNVSRTHVSETWLSPLPLTPKGHKALDTRATITIERSRFSVSTINTDLFPELLSWSATMDYQSPSPCSQIIPSDIIKANDLETVQEVHVELSLSHIFDPTTLEIGFDESCFDGLDDLLIYSPMDAYAALCWSDGVRAHTHSKSEPMGIFTPTPSPSKNLERTRKRQIRSPLVIGNSSSDESDTDSDEYETYREDDEPSHPAFKNGHLSGVRTVGELPSYLNEKSLYFNDDGCVSSFMAFESRFSVPNPTESVGCFPIPAHRPESVPRRIATFCSNLPANLNFVRPSASS